MSRRERTIIDLKASIKEHVGKIVAAVSRKALPPDLIWLNDAALLCADIEIELWKHQSGWSADIRESELSDQLQTLQEWWELAIDLEKQGRRNEIDFKKCPTFPRTKGGDENPVEMDSTALFDDPVDKPRRYLAKPSKYLFQVLLRQSRCCGNHIARLHLDGFHTQDEDTATRFSLFLSSNPEPPELKTEWHETSCELFMYETTCMSTKSALTPSCARQDTDEEASAYPDGFCRLLSLCKEYTEPLHVEIRQRSGSRPIVLANRKESNQRLDTPTQCLGSLLDQHWLGNYLIDGAMLSGEKAALSLNLSLALIHLSPDVWVRNEWSIDNIFLSWSSGALNGCRIPTIDAQRPYLSIRLNDKKETPPPSTIPRVDVVETRMLSFAQVLMEISTGKRLPQGSQPESDRRSRLKSWIQRSDYQLQTTEPVRQAVASCLTAARAEQKEEVSTNEWIYNEIISKLDRNWRQYGISAPPKPREWNIDFLTMNTSKASTRAEGVVSESMPSNVDHFNGSVSSRHGDRSSLVWFQKMEGLQLILASPRQPTRTRVAVLDTGITQKEAKAYGIPSESYRDFTGAEESQMTDRTGHGSTIVRLIYRMCDFTDIFVARVWEEDIGTDNQTAEAAVKAVKWAIEQKFDIICMAFGFNRAIPELEKALRKASHEDILMFAAASNHGNSADITYPASWNSLVFCTFSTNANIKSFDFNPTGLDLHNFAILGENIEVSDDSKTSKLVSGTSYSTALACGLTALLLNFSKQCSAIESRGNELAKVLKYRDRMTKVLRKVSSPHAGYQCIAPWKLLPLNLQAQLPLKEGSGFDKRTCNNARAAICDTLTRELDLDPHIWVGSQGA
ncbi:hypothetical protein BDP67DRAFT_445760 [Colletotrichum lupini]|nr:hypothetical protein BDP67DRAFT_445760 [Colletotrichum lupini]